MYQKRKEYITGNRKDWPASFVRNIEEIHVSPYSELSDTARGFLGNNKQR